MAFIPVKTIQAIEVSDLVNFIQEVYDVDISSDFYEEFNAPSDGAIRYHMASSKEEWEGYREDMFLFYAIDQALNLVCDLPWNSSIYILTSY